MVAGRAIRKSGDRVSLATTQAFGAEIMPKRISGGWADFSTRTARAGCALSRLCPGSNSIRIEIVLSRALDAADRRRALRDPTPRVLALSTRSKRVFGRVRAQRRGRNALIEGSDKLRRRGSRRARDVRPRRGALRPGRSRCGCCSTPDTAGRAASCASSSGTKIGHPPLIFFWA